MVNKVKRKGKEVAASLPVGNIISGNLDRKLISRTSTSEPSRSGKGFCSPAPPAANRILAVGDGLNCSRDEGVLSIGRDEVPHSNVNLVYGQKPLQACVPSTQQEAAGKVFDGSSSRVLPSVQSGNRTCPASAKILTSCIPSHELAATQCVNSDVVHPCCIHAAALLQSDNPQLKSSDKLQHNSADLVNVHSPANASALGFEYNVASAAGSLQQNPRFDAAPKQVKSYAAAVKGVGVAAQHSRGTVFSNKNLGGQNNFSSKSFQDAETEISSFGQRLEMDGRQVVSFSVEEFNELVIPFQYSLVGKFSHGFPSMKTLRLVLGNLNLKDAFSVSLLEEKHVLIRLSCEEDYTRLWCRQIWHIAGYPMRVSKWTPDFSPLVEAPYAPVWVLFPYLPVHLFDKRSLSIIASSLGKPLRMDSATAALTRASVARVCIELDVTKTFLPEVEINIGGKTIFQPVEFENIPKYCGLCKHLGHISEKCLTSTGKSDVRSDRGPVISSGVIVSSRGPEVGTIEISGNGKCVLIDDSNSPPSISLNPRALREDLLKSLDKFPLIPPSTITEAASEGVCSDGQESATEDWYSEDDKTRIVVPPYTRHMAKLRRRLEKDEVFRNQGRPRPIIPYHSVLPSFKAFYNYRCRRTKRQVKNQANSVNLST